MKITLSLQVHLPDEECSNCGMQFPATKIQTHQKDCGKAKETGEGHHDQGCNGTKRKLDTEITDGKLLSNFSSQSGPEEEATECMSSRKETKKAAVDIEHKVKDSSPQNISIRYGTAKYSVKLEPERKMARVMKKLAKMVGNQVKDLVFKAERSGKVITGEETMKEFVREVIVVQ